MLSVTDFIWTEKSTCLLIGILHENDELFKKSTLKKCDVAKYIHREMLKENYRPSEASIMDKIKNLKYR